jgi:hypothetical protein
VFKHYIRRSGQYPGGTFIFEKPCVHTEDSVNVVSSVLMITVGLSLNLTKQRPGAHPIGPKEFHQNGK